MKNAQAKAAEPLLAIDRKARKLSKPYKDTAPVRTLAWIGQAGDQLQLRVLCGGVAAIGLLRRDARMVQAGVRMLAAHELATLAKTAVKDRVDRWRPRNPAAGRSVKPRQGPKKAKERSSFPSGHSAGATAVACAAAAAYPGHGGTALAAASAVSLAQVPTAAHYPSDVAAGMAIGAASAATVGLAWRLAARLVRLATRRD